MLMFYRVSIDQGIPQQHTPAQFAGFAVLRVADFNQFAAAT
jgi:hypothetical protein